MVTISLGYSATQAYLWMSRSFDCRNILSIKQCIQTKNQNNRFWSCETEITSSSRALIEMLALRKYGDAMFTLSCGILITKGSTTLGVEALLSVFKTVCKLINQIKHTYIDTIFTAFVVFWILRLHMIMPTPKRYNFHYLSFYLPEETYLFRASWGLFY